MNRRRIIIVSVMAMCALLGGITLWLAKSHDAVLQGKLESEWIGEIQYSGGDAQAQQWRALGPEGLQLLARTLDQGRYYYKFYWWTAPKMGRVLSPSFERRFNPDAVHPSRVNVISLLCSLGKDAEPVEPAIARAVTDGDVRVRQNALACYESGLLEVIGEKAKAERLSLFLDAMKSSDWCSRNNAAVALGFYTNDAPKVLPVLIKALGDSEVHVRLVVAKDLAHPDPAEAVKAGVIPVMLPILKDKDDQIACRAAEILGEMGKDAVPAIPELEESARGTNKLVAYTAKRALKKIAPPQPGGSRSQNEKAH